MIEGVIAIGERGNQPDSGWPITGVRSQRAGQEAQAFGELVFFKQIHPGDEIRPGQGFFELFSNFFGFEEIVLFSC